MGPFLQIVWLALTVIEGMMKSELCQDVRVGKLREIFLC